jgi:hypothetical protein
MRALAILGVLCAGPTFADCQDELSLGRAGLGASEFRIVEPGVVSESGGRCRLSDLTLQQGRTLKLEVSSMSWVADGFETLLIGAPEGLSLDLRVEDARLVPQTPDPWMSYFLDLQNRRNFINIEALMEWSPETGILEVERFVLDLPGENGFQLSSSVTGATADMLPGRLSGFDALTLAAVSLTVKNEGYLDGLALGWMLGQLSLMPGEPETVVASTLEKFQDIVADWPGDVFPPDSKANLTEMIAAGPFPWGRFDLVMAEGEITLDRLVTLGMSPDPFGAQAMADAWAGSVFEIQFEPSDGRE